MAAKLTIERQDESDRSRLTLKGIIDEQADFKKAFSDLKPLIFIDLAGIDLINSCGVREWVQAVQRFPKNATVQYENCAPRIVEQINYVANFLGPGVVHSFFAPYFCPKCKKETTKLLTVKDLAKLNPLKAPTEKCPTCKGAMEFDDVEEEYFSFLTGR